MESYKIDADAQKASLFRIKRKQQKEVKYGKVNIDIKDGIVTITGNYYSPGMIDALAYVGDQECYCGCNECQKGLHAVCYSDGQSCYRNWAHRVNDGIYMGKIVTNENQDTLH